MIEALFNQPNLLAAKRLLDVTAARHEAIASNLANIETPNYRRVDVAPSFERELQSAVASRDLQPQRRDIVKVGDEEGTLFALDPVSQQEMSSGDFASRDLTLTFNHR